MKLSLVRMKTVLVVFIAPQRKAPCNATLIGSKVARLMDSQVKVGAPQVIAAGK
jgi:hypothetical protein